MSLSSIALLCGTCGAEFVVPLHRTEPGMTCRACNSPLPKGGVIIAPNDQALGQLFQETRIPIFVGFHAAARLPTRGLRELMGAAKRFENRALIVTGAVTSCRELLAMCKIQRVPAYLLVLRGVRVAMLEGEAEFDKVQEWMCAMMSRYEMPPMAFHPAPCLRCGGRSLIRCLPVEHGVTDGTDTNPIQLRRLAATHAAHANQWTEGLSVRKTEANQDPMHSAGELEAFVCRACGHVEWFASAPGSIPIGPQHRTELVQVDEGSSYR